MLRLVKVALTAGLVALLAGCGAAWIGLDQAARRAVAEASKPWGDRLAHARVSVRLLPPSAVMEDVVLRNAEGDELLRASRVALPLLPGAWTGKGTATASPRLEDWTFTLDVPRGDAANWAEAIGGEQLPRLEWWQGSGGTVAIRFGEGARGESLRLTQVELRRRKYSLRMTGTVEGIPGSRSSLVGDWDPSGGAPARFALSAGPFDAGPWTAWLLAPAEGRVRAGRLHLGGEVTFPARSFRFDGRLSLEDVLVEGAGGAPGSLETLLHRGNGSARLSIVVEGPYAGGADWRARTCQAIAAAARADRATATR